MPTGGAESKAPIEHRLGNAYGGSVPGLTLPAPVAAHHMQAEGKKGHSKQQRDNAPPSVQQQEAPVFRKQGKKAVPVAAPVVAPAAALEQPPVHPPAPAPPAAAAVPVAVPVPAPAQEQQPRLLSAGKPVTSDVRGNLGPPSVVTSETMEDWRTDRWQAAADMSGSPIPGPHWLEMELQLTSGGARVERVVLDWEDAYSTQWTLQGRLSKEAQWEDMAQGSDHPLGARSKWHVLQEVRLSPPSTATPVRYLRLLIHGPSTQWGSSLWRFQVWGVQVEQR